MNYCPSEVEISAGGKALRERQQAGRITVPWDSLPPSARRKWRDHATVVLCAAYMARAKLMERLSSPPPPSGEGGK